MIPSFCQNKEINITLNTKLFEHFQWTGGDVGVIIMEIIQAAAACINFFFFFAGYHSCHLNVAWSSYGACIYLYNLNPFIIT